MSVGADQIVEEIIFAAADAQWRYGLNENADLPGWRSGCAGWGQTRLYA